jgi:hypothetical protein
MIMSRRELEDAGLVRKDRRLSRLTSLETEGEEASLSSSSYTKARYDRRAISTQVDEQASGDDPRATTRSDIEARMAERRSSRRQTESDVVGSTTHMTLDELRSRREETKSFLSGRARGSSVEPRAASDGEAENDDEDECSGEATLSTRERIRQRAERRGVPRRTKSADEDMMTMRDSAKNLYSELGEKLEPKHELQARRLQRQNRPALLASTDLTTRLKERRNARAAEREAREREKKDEIGLIRRLSRHSVIGSHTSDDCACIPDLEFSDEETEEDSDPGWSVRLCVVSAMDLPLNVVPNVPLYPIIKLGLVRLPTSSSRENEQAATEVVMTKLWGRSVELIKSAKVRTTTQKLLGKRDNGALDFHQEYRWDGVKHPEDTGLCVELWAGAVRTPTNFMESPSALALRNAFTVSESQEQSREPSRGVIRSSTAKSTQNLKLPRQLLLSRDCW